MWCEISYPQYSDLTSLDKRVSLVSEGTRTHQFTSAALESLHIEDESVSAVSIRQLQVAVLSLSQTVVPFRRIVGKILIHKTFNEKGFEERVRRLIAYRSGEACDGKRCSVGYFEGR